MKTLWKNELPAIETNRPRIFTENICTSDHYAPPARILRSPGFHPELAQFYVDLNLSGAATVDWVLTEIYDYRSGKLFGPDGKLIAVESEDADDVALFDNMFRQDERRFITRYRARAAKPFRNRLQTRCLLPVLMMHFARQIYLCRTIGNCSHT